MIMSLPMYVLGVVITYMSIMLMKTYFYGIDVLWESIQSFPFDIVFKMSWYSR